MKALYGHPESGGHWERHLTEAVLRIGGEKIPEHPSSFWFKDWRLVLSVYVDDLLVSGPAEHHEEFWSTLQKKGGVRIEPPEPVDRFLGRKHVTN